MTLHTAITAVRTWASHEGNTLVHYECLREFVNEYLRKLFDGPELDELAFEIDEKIKFIKGE